MNMDKRININDFNLNQLSTFDRNIEEEWCQ